MAAGDTILRKQQRAGWAVIDNEILQDDRLSYRARGVAAYLLSKPNDWTINLAHLTHAGTEGRDAVRNAIHELAELGYLKRARESGGYSKTRLITYLADYPAFAEDGTVWSRINGYDGENRPTENQPTENQYDEDQPTENQQGDKSAGEFSVGHTKDCFTNDGIQTTTEEEEEEGARTGMAQVFRTWQDNMPGTLSPILSEQITDLVLETSPESVLYGIRQAVAASARKLTYVRACATRHAAGDMAAPQRNGNGAGYTNGRPAPSTKTERSMAAVDRVFARLESGDTL